MYSLVMLAAMTAGPDVPQAMLCPVTPSNYGCGFWLKHSFYDCCAPARYGWVNCYNKGFSAYPGGAWSFCGGCCNTYGPFFMPSPCNCAPCGGHAYPSCGPTGCGFCGHGWGVADTPAYYASVLGCPPGFSAPPYAHYTEKHPCCNLNFAFDTGLAGHSAGVGFAGFGGYGNFGFYGAVPMMHKPTTADLPPFPRPDWPSIGLTPSTPVPMPPLPGTTGTPKLGTPAIPPDSLLPAPPMMPPSPMVPDVKKDEPKKEEPKKSKTESSRPARAIVVLSVPSRATVTVEGTALTSTGSERSFRTPELRPGEEFVYEVKATIALAGRDEVETIQVKVQAGETSRASFEKLFAKLESAAARSVVDAKPGK
ncbi:MAG TPA: TIGR03000 domain-containing protein [Gemmataceae bacterium]|jgi:uncharacterized protein (TIGR03000 family)|nr:TIGR03000 domain-containing protein [Gemmataceae bacterium]